MTQNDIRNGFNEAIAQLDDLDQIAKLELCREYFTNDEFRATLEDHVWQLSQKEAA